MRNIEEQLIETERRSEELKSARVRRRTAAAAVLCLAAIAVLSVFIARMPQVSLEMTDNPSFGSLVAGGPFLAYFVIGFISFLLGISFTMLCIRVNWRDRR